MTNIHASDNFGDDLKLFREIEVRLYSAVISDALDALGYRDQVMREYLRPWSAGAPFAGRARTVLCRDQYHIPDDPYTVELEALDSVLPGEVVVVATGGSRRNVPWGELLSTAARARGARGAVVDGLIRDVSKIREMNFPVYAAGSKPVDSKGRGIVVEYNVPVECGGVGVNPGDLIFADEDGVVAVPADLIEPVVALASEKVAGENKTREELLAGRFLRDVYAKYGIL